MAVLAYLAVAWQPAIAPIQPPAASSFSVEQVEKGRILASAGRCIDCHTVTGGAAGTGGVAFKRMLGIVYSTNITPDAETGIGRWSLAAFTRALREGVRRDGNHLFPVFPFVHFSKLSDTDIGALYAYLMSRPPVKGTVPANTMPFPLNVRALQAAWKAIYLEPGPYQADPARSDAWNRGAYLVEGLTHCADCHTPRNLVGAEERGHPYAGALVGLLWATPLDVTPSPASWTNADLIHYLRSGESETHGVALTDMQKVVLSLRDLSDPDISAMVTYLATQMAPRPNHEAAIAKASKSIDPQTDDERIGAKAYLDACGRCHEKPGATPEAARAPLSLSSALWMADPNNVLYVVLDGIQRQDGLPGPTMPGLRDQLNDVQIATIAQYLRKTFTTLPAWGEMPNAVRKMRAGEAP